jgi:hypothetical protein
MRTISSLSRARRRLLAGQSLKDNMFCGLLAMSLLLSWEYAATAQGLSSSTGSNTAPVVGGAGVRPPSQLPIISGTLAVGAKLHRGPMGQLCVSVSGYGEAQIVNPKIFTHWVTAKNECSQPIKLRVCYYQTEQCIDVTVPGYSKKEEILGIMPDLWQFRFQYQEKFNPYTDGLGSN